MEQKRFLLAVVLSMGILMLFQSMQKTATNNTDIGKNETVVEENTAIQKPTINPGPSQALINKELDDEEDIVISTEKYKITFSNAGGAVKKIEYLDPVAQKEEILMSEDNPYERLFALSSDQVKSLETVRYEYSQNPDNIEFILNIPGNFQIRKKYYLPTEEEYLRLDLEIENNGTNPNHFTYSIIGPSGVREAGKMKNRSFLEAAFDIDGKIVRKKGKKDIFSQTGALNWAGIIGRYFGVFVKPLGDTEQAFLFGEKEEMTIAIAGKGVTINPSEVVSEEFLLYAGPVEEKQMKNFGYGLENVINYGWFGGITKIMLKILRFFYSLVGNWGIAIILLTIVVNGIAFPLTKKSFVSMHKMKELQPYMQKLKELHKDNPQKLNKEMMELYKKYQINPFGGCLPMLLQLPIFISLYHGLTKAFELRGASFLWIKDLAKPDSLQLPFSLPIVGASINILPIIMLFLMVAQQKVHTGSTEGLPPEQAQQQKMMMFMMPIVFGFIFYTMPSGVVLYWLTNTFLMLIEHSVLRKQLT